MIRKTIIGITTLFTFVVGASMSSADDKCNNLQLEECDSIVLTIDSVSISADSIFLANNDSIAIIEEKARFTTLTDYDYQKVADELNIEVAAMKAVVQIEAGSKLEGFWAPGVPIINFDKSVYNSMKKVSCSKKAPNNSKIPDGISSSYGRKEWTQLINARKNNEDRANMSTFWGMFQIGGFNYKLCGCASIDEFIAKMSESELAQLELFAAFITNTDIVKYLRTKNWAAFARKYNGPSYAKRGYHTKMAKAYKKFSNQ